MHILLLLFALATTHLAAQTARTEWRISARPTLSLGTVDGVGPEVFGNVVGAARQASGTIVVADGLALKFFSSSGTFLRHAGRSGAGPGEFRTIKAARVCGGDSTFVYDPALMRLSVFSPDGTYSRAIDVRTLAGTAKAYDFWCNRAGVLVFVHKTLTPPTGVGPRRPLEAISLVGRDGAAVSLGTFAASERYFDGSEDFPRPLGKVTSIGVGSDVVFLATGDAYEIQIFSHRGSPRTIVREARPAAPVQDRHVDAFVNEQLARRALLPNIRALERLYREIEYPQVFPALGRLLVDPTDNVWVEDYPIPGAAQRQWTVFSKSGTRLATISVPANFQLHDVSTDSVFGLWRDEDGVVFVRQYTLIKP